MAEMEVRGQVGDRVEMAATVKIKPLLSMVHQLTSIYQVKMAMMGKTVKMVIALTAVINQRREIVIFMQPMALRVVMVVKVEMGEMAVLSRPITLI
ncbi:asparagine synthase [Nostoc cycadae WK-1]|uniref:Asparagine synthase n=1 Tax=Nostoc cycadae WK-1 TaxID=1861711 RepID=A0A2H6LLI7_9NOSO|nr:asparagine synthase [Nostoc cycadae WK-1]